MLPLYIRVYVIFVLSYLWYRFLLRFIADVRSKNNYPIYERKTSILVPVFNEDPTMLQKCVKSLVDAAGDNEIIIVDDKGNPNCWKIIRQLKIRYPQIKILRLHKNQGKRKAQYNGLNRCSGDVIVTIDSDTIIDKHAIVELCKPLNDPKIGATTGFVEAYNKDHNFLTKMIHARYLNAFSFERKALTSFGIVNCCSGVLSAYRRELFDSIKEDYITQTFLNKECTYGDDRHLTNLILRKGHKVVYVDSAKAKTDVPTNMKQFIKQQIRWKKSFFRESWITLCFSYKTNKMLFVETIYSMLLPIISLMARILVVYLIIMYPILIIPIALSIITVALIRNLLLLFEKGLVSLYAIPYAFLHELVIYWLNWYALLTLKDVSWGTR